MKRTLTLFAITLAGPTLASEDIPVRLEMLDGWQTEVGTRMVAMKIELAPGWKTYWRSPGDAGVPPRIDWTGSKNLSDAEIHWPTPSIFDDEGLRTIGYKHEVVLPLELTPVRAGRLIRAEGVLTIGVCEDICVPVDLPFRLDAEGGSGPDPAISAALAHQPKVVEASALSAIACRVDPIDDGVRLTARLKLPLQGGAEAAIFEHQDAGLWVGEAELNRKGGTIEISADLVPPDAQPFALDRSGIRLTVIGSDGATEIRGCPAG